MSLNSSAIFGSGLATLAKVDKSSDASYSIQSYHILGYISIGLILLCAAMACRLDRLIIAHFPDHWKKSKILISLILAKVFPNIISRFY
ncbi:MAG: hypothetical protein IPJ13_00940 [Saprospiraceae bacterium]|nr:hypothetical protein [Saprospiraceae bacterium]